jgi:hypothetical protein
MVLFFSRLKGVENKNQIFPLGRVKNKPTKKAGLFLTIWSKK